MRKIIVAGLIASTLATAYLVSITWYSKPFVGVVNDEYGRAVSGVVVSLGWIVKSHNPNLVVFRSAVTDSSGVFEVSGWLHLVPWPMSRMVGSPFLYAAKEGYSPVRLTSGGITYNTDATPTFTSAVVIRRTKQEDIERELIKIYGFANQLCADMHLPLDNQKANEILLLKREIEHTLESISNQKTITRELPCF